MGLRESMRMVAKEYGKSHWSQISEISRLALGAGLLTPREYYYYRLFDDSRLSFADKTKFVGQTTQEQIKKILIDNKWKILSDDKFIFAMLFQSQGFPLAQVFATYNYNRNKRGFSIPSCNTVDELKSFLANRVEYPLFAKPVANSYGLGCIGLDSLDRTTNLLTLGNGETLTIDQLIERLRQFPDGYLFQERIHPHRVLRDICGDRLATVRVVVLLEPQGARIFRACCRIPIGTNMSDNWSHGQTGNLLAAVSLEDGRLESVYRGIGINQERCERHPDTGKQIEGRVLPYWQEVKDLCVEAAALLPGFHLQAWDIAIRDDGPLLQEVQGGDFEILQISSQQGILNEDFQRYLRSVNNFWRQEIYLSMLDEMPRKAYRRCYPKRNGGIPGSG